MRPGWEEINSAIATRERDLADVEGREAEAKATHRREAERRLGEGAALDEEIRAKREQRDEVAAELETMRRRFSAWEETMTTNAMADLASKVALLPGGYITRSGRRPGCLRVKCSKWGEWGELTRADVEALIVAAAAPEPPQAA